MSGDYVYPDRYDVSQTMSEFCLRSFLDEFAQKRGIFITNTGLVELADFLANLTYEYKELEEIRAAALQPHGKKVLSGFRINSDDIEFSLVNLFDEHREKVIDKKNDMKLRAIFSPAQTEPKIFQGSVDYIKKKPGRVQFLQGTEKNFTYFLRHIFSGLWEILIDGSSSNDARLLEEWLKRALPSGSEIQNINQDKLTTSQTIKFFDNLGKCATTPEWRLVQVTRLILRRESSTDKEDNDDEKSIEDTGILSGITTAILEGTELRNNSFVKKCEEGGYRFTAMNYEFEHKREPFVQVIRAEFKKKPKIFEVALEKHSQRKGLEGKLEQINLSESERIQTLSAFWDNAKQVFDNLLVT